ncbi:ArsR/SmtB family transcription factor [Roseibium album]|uniref:ArsR/SmtB family transcription factor n=1 Tax=Roseibium album TaxID=311410 RepID=UPI000CF0A8EF|nr:DNA-binding transcriptional ArsR family regulator [Labrenzia sp. EL_142]MBG6157999.1 DNA-binding transcriptional ArsR family regulator [Labrenzia sp. EL_162]MBG6165100.1 DNA-binding transcriptional ArsR family regulator [Labrenzia sp. EL_195]MBG6196990.1 DNA-binding transcriptional ArsR family regulator [Labrenzia sp. EL_159]
MPPQKATSDVFHAIADPNRRALLGFLAHESKPVGECVDELGITYSAVSQHLSVLREVGLVESESRGRQRLYRSRFEPLQAVHDWTALYRPFWQNRLKGLGDYLNRKDSEGQE